MPEMSLSNAAAIAAALASLLLLSGCMTLRGPQDFSCPGFFGKVYDGQPGRFIADIQSDGAAPPAGLAPSEDDPLAASIAQLVENKALKNVNQRDVLLLSGGGQWGAFGAGLFSKLAEDSKTDMALPNIGVITGISTGSLQTLLLMAALDEGKDPEIRRLAMEQLVWGYSPAHESEVVNNTGMASVIWNGSQAGTGPLRRRIRDALCPKGDCRLLGAIENSNIDGYIGFVEAREGKFQYVRVRELLAMAKTTDEKLECLAAATMASSAMPVFHQQLRVSEDRAFRTLYDGGVRRSVFYEKAMEAMDQAVKDKLGELAKTATLAEFAAGYARAAPVVYVVRNGPTMRDEKSELDNRVGAKGHGMRGYDLLVNEAEMGSIAALRLYNPFGRIRLTTADNWENSDGPARLCTKEVKGDAMFSPKFMECLRGHGARKAVRTDENGRPLGPWWDLRPIDPLGVMASEGLRPASD